MKLLFVISEHYFEAMSLGSPSTLSVMRNVFAFFVFDRPICVLEMFSLLRQYVMK